MDLTAIAAAPGAPAPAPPRIDSIDHFVLTVASISASCAFYQRALGMEVVRFGAGRTALRFGSQKINLHQLGEEAKPNAREATPGSGDFCLITRSAIADVVAHLRREAIEIELGPVERTGALGPMASVYFRDPDGNLVEVARYAGR